MAKATSRKLAMKRGQQPRPESMRDAFIREYLADPHRNGKQAAIRAGYSPKTAESQASRLLRSVKVRTILDRADAEAVVAVAKVIDRYAVTKERVVEELAKLAFSDIRQIVNFGPTHKEVTTLDGEVRKVPGVTIIASNEIDAAAAAAIAEVSETRGGIKVKLADKRSALMDLAKLCNFIDDKPQGSPLEAALLEMVQSIVSRESALPVGRQRQLAPAIDAEVVPPASPAIRPST